MCIRDRYINQMTENYNNSQEKYHVTYAVQDSMEEKLVTAIAGGDVPDIVMWDRFTTATYAAKGAFMPLDDYIAGDRVDMDQFYQPTVEEMKGNDGKQYGVPLTVDTRILFYNKDLLKEAGVNPEEISTWDALKTAAAALTKRDAGGTVSYTHLTLPTNSLV